MNFSDNTFDLVYVTGDYEAHYFFDGPDDATDEDFEKLCNSLLPKAGYKAALKQLSSKHGSWIVWSDVVESLVSLLEEQGYQRVYIDTYYLHGGNIIGIYNVDNSDNDRLGFASDIIRDYNKKLEAKLAEERKNKRSLRGLFKKKVIQIIK